MSQSTVPYALAVEDDPFVQMEIVEILQGAGFRCHSADDGDAAKEMLPLFAESITLLFSDVEMPGATNGFDLARHVAEQYPWIEVVIASGKMRPSEGEMPPGATFIAKPFSASMIYDHLREILPDGKQPKPLKTAA